MHVPPPPIRQYGTTKRSYSTTFQPSGLVTSQASKGGREEVERGVEGGPSGKGEGGVGGNGKVGEGKVEEREEIERGGEEWGDLLVRGREGLVVMHIEKCLVKRN